MSKRSQAIIMVVGGLLAWIAFFILMIDMYLTSLAKREILMFLQ